ncbi:MAG TPA: hypothetical protein PKD80_04800 [Microthrixaceae bacterium]|nr:hypothetical protein [Microthrixaceae bacterium]HMT26626.1 hypothetical protein [Microthrixaceae bacterium]HMT61348.1 hypothetical protein [Microthrixaceae bacterium]
MRDRKGAGHDHRRWFTMFAVLACTACAGREDHATRGADTTAADERLQELVAASDLGDPAVVEVPAPTSGDATQWLNGEGGTATQLVAISRDLWLRGAPACPDVAEELDALATPEEVLAAAAGTPDEPSRDVLVNLHRAVSQALAACADVGELDAMLPSLAWQWALADDRLDALGVDR